MNKKEEILKILAQDYEDQMKMGCKDEAHRTLRVRDAILLGNHFTADDLATSDGLGA